MYRVFDEPLPEISDWNGTGATCDSTYESVEADDGWLWYCTLRPYHAGPHQAGMGDGTMIAEWSETENAPGSGS